MGANEWVAGLDGCRRGWIAVIAASNHAQARVRFAKSVLDVVDAPEAPGVIALDIPIGLPDWARYGQLWLDGGRTPERLVRPLLGARQSSVFSIPSRPAVYAASDETVSEPDRFRHACAIARATSADGKAVAKQGFQIFRRIIEIDCVLRGRPELTARVFECHPEVSFWAMNDKTSIPEPKKARGSPFPPGIAFRRRLLVAHGFDPDLLQASVARECGAGLDDLIDACAAAWTAANIARGQAISFPDPPERDRFDLPIAIWV